MNVDCPYCSNEPNYVSDFRTIRLSGSFHRKSDSKSVKRFRCLTCLKSFSQATKDPRFRQKKRQKNNRVYELFASGVSERRIARLLRINRKTVARKLIFLGRECREEVELKNQFREVNEFEFDDMETFEHSKCKPVSITLAVESKSRRILGFEVASMSAKGRLAKKALRLYGSRLEERRKKRRDLFRKIRPFIAEQALIKSDSNPYYRPDVREFFPKARYVQILGARGAVTGQGELKKTGFDPIFSLNHTAAMFRANVASLIRKTWCTTKKRERLADRLAIYSHYHNAHLKMAI